MSRNRHQYQEATTLALSIATYWVGFVEGRDTWSLIHHVDGRFLTLLLIGVMNDDEFILVVVTTEHACNDMRRVPRDYTLKQNGGSR